MAFVLLVAVSLTFSADTLTPSCVHAAQKCTLKWPDLSTKSGVHNELQPERRKPQQGDDPCWAAACWAAACWAAACWASACWAAACSMRILRNLAVRSFWLWLSLLLWLQVRGTGQRWSRVNLLRR